MRGWLALPTWFWSGCAPQVRFPGLWLNAAGVEVKNWKPRKRRGFPKRLVGGMVLLLKKQQKRRLAVVVFIVVLGFNSAKFVPLKNIYFSKNYTDFAESKSYNAGTQVLQRDKKGFTRLC